MGESLDALLDIPGESVAVHKIIDTSKGEIGVIRKPGTGEHEPSEKDKHGDGPNQEPFPPILFFAGRYTCLFFLFRLQNYSLQPAIVNICRFISAGIDNPFLAMEPQVEHNIESFLECIAWISSLSVSALRQSPV